MILNTDLIIRGDIILSKLNIDKLHLTLDKNITSTSPIVNRMYTLTHSDETGELFLYIGLNYDLSKITSFRDEVLAKWNILNGQYILNIDLYVGGDEFNFDVQSKRYEIFNKELPLALEAIVYGDRPLFLAHPELNNAPISVKFNSIYPKFNNIKFLGYIKDFKIKD